MALSDVQPASQATYRAVPLIFTIFGVSLANYAVHIPALQAHLGLTEGALGLILLSEAAGSIVGALCAGWVITHVGSRVALVGASFAFTLLMAPLLLVTNVPLWVLLLFLHGIGGGMMDVAMNSQGTTLENQARRPLMSRLHGLASLGSVGGSLLIAGFASLGLPPVLRAALIGVVLQAVVLWSAWALLPHQPRAKQKAGQAAAAPLRLRGPLLLIGLLALLAFLAESIALNWSGVYMERHLLLEPSAASLGFTAFMIAMTVGRFSGDALVARFGGALTAQISVSVGLIGLLLGLLANTYVAMLLGFACFGFSIANLLPTAFRLAARLGGASAGYALALVTTLGYVSFLLATPLPGFVADTLGLPAAVGIGVVCNALALGLLGLIYRQPALSGQPAQAHEG